MQLQSEIETKGDHAQRALGGMHERFASDCAGAMPRVVAKEGKGESMPRS